MRKLTLLFASFVLVLWSASFAKGQDIGAGIRATPDGGGLTGKFFFSKNFAVEAQLNASVLNLGGYGGNSATAVGLAEYHIILPDPSWRIFFGGGIHFGTWDRYDDGVVKGIFGIDAIGGVEYMFKAVPIGVSADIKPAINLVSDVDFFPHNFFGLAGRYYFGQPSKMKHAPHHK